MSTPSEAPGTRGVATQNGGERKDSAALGKSVAAPVGIVVERLTHEDIPAVTGLYKRVWESFRPELPPEILKSWEPSALEFSSQMEGITFFSAREAGKILGVVGCAIANGSCRLVQLAVDPDARRRGIGSQLTRAAEDWARHNNVHEIWVDALARFTAAAALFRQRGFTESGVLHRHFWNEDVRFFEKVL